MSSDARQSARDFARGYIEPAAAGWEAGRQIPRDAFREAARCGLTGIMVPVELGGLGLGFMDAAGILEELAAADAGFTFGLWVHNNVANAIVRNANHQQRDTYLPDLLAGNRIGAFCLTEPDAGSDAGAISMLARREGDGWRLDGKKAWVTNGCHADLLLIYAQTEPGAGASGIAAFTVDGNSPGVERGDPYGLVGGTGFGLAGIAASDCRLSADSLFIPPGEGLRAAMRGINQARAFVGVICNGMLACGLETAVQYAAGRSAFGQKVLDFQGLQWALADVATDLEASRLLTSKALQDLESGAPAVMAAAHAKKFASRIAFDGLSATMQAMGAAGLLSDYPIARHLAAAKMMHFIDGTTEIQNIVIFRELMRAYETEGR